jgi:hypothetical protein
MSEQYAKNEKLAYEHITLTRRYFLGLGITGMAGLGMSSRLAAADDLSALVAKLDYLTKEAEFGNVERGDPLPYTLPPAKLREIGMTRDTWKLDVISDPSSPAKLQNPMSRERGNALDFVGLMNLAETKAVRYLKVMTCNNLNSPLGMGLWEGVPLREVIWMTKPVGDIRRVFYYGHHNEDPKQMFQSSLPISRIMEDPPGWYPVLLCYKLNGEFLSGHRGGPVRILVPETYGFKSVKWLHRVVLTNLHGANDTYAAENNDIDSWMKTFARYLTFPTEVKAGKPIPITGVAQSGISGLSKVQYWLHPEKAPYPIDDPYFTKALWQDAQIFSAPDRWGGGLADGNLPAGTIGIDPSTGKPRSWPMQYSIVHWAALIKNVPTGKYVLRCRTIDANGVAQPLPRPFGRSGLNHIEQVSIAVGS